MRLSSCLAIASSALLVSAPVLAADSQELGESGQFILSAERLFGLNHTSFKDDDSTLRALRFTVLSSGTPETSASILSPLAVPRLAGDWVVAPRVTLGGGAGLAYSNYSIDGDDQVTNFGFLVSPRVGYVVPLGGGATFWIRGGVTYFRSNNAPDAGSSRTWSHVSVTIEPAFTFPIAGNASFLLAPVADIPLSGTYKSPTRTQTITALTFGANCGLLVHF